jgi:hypothetical protein
MHKTKSQFHVLQMDAAMKNVTHIKLTTLAAHTRWFRNHLSTNAKTSITMRGLNRAEPRAIPNKYKISGKKCSSYETIKRQPAD